MVDKFNKPIPAETFIKAVSEVRKIEYYINEEKYPYSVEALYCIFMNSDWQFEKHYYSKEEIILANILGVNIDKEHTKTNDFINLIYDNTEKEIKGVQLTKILKKELERRKNK